MSWKEVFRELSDMEGIVQRMEEETEEPEVRDEAETGTEEEESDLQTKLMREIKGFNKKTQLRNVNDSKNEDVGDDDGVETINISPDDEPALESGGTRFNFDFRPGDRMSLIDRSEKLIRRGSGHSGSGILRRPSLGVEPVSPAAASADRLSVTFANETVVMQDEVREDEVEDKDPVSLILGSLKRTISTASGLRRGSLSSVDHKTYVSFDSPEPDIAPPEIPCDHHDDDGEEEEDEEESDVDNDEDEYSSGIREILEMNQSLDVRRRSSGGSRRSRRMSTVSGMVRSSSSRPTSRHSEESRRSESVYENLKLHREVVDQVKYQLWPLDKKLRMVRQAKLFVSQHEKEMKNQLKSDKSFGSYVKQCWITTVEIFLMVIRWVREHLDYLIPWEGRIKRIESQFGSVVSSYFLFLRWVVYVNLIITIVITAFIILPELLSGHWEGSGIRKEMLSIEEKTSRNLKVLWDFEGILRYSPLFYGWYGNQAKSKTGYETPQAYFIVMMVVYIFSFVIILHKMQEANKQSKLSEKADEATFTWKIFCSWDYGIANVEAAHNKVSAIVMGLREAILEANESERDKEQDWRTIAKRSSSWFLFVLSLIGSAYCVVLVVDRSNQPEADKSFWRQNEVTFTMTMIGSLLPKFFGSLELLEKYHPRKAMQYMLARIMILNLLNLYSLIFALIQKTNSMSTELHNFKMMNDSSLISGQTTVLAMAESVECFNIPIPCHVLDTMEAKMTSDEDFGLKYRFDKDSPVRGAEEKEVYRVSVLDPALEQEMRRQLEGNNTDLLDSMVMNISDTLIHRDKSARLRMLWEDLTYDMGRRNGSFGDCTQEECKIECEPKCSHLCEIFFSCADGGSGDLVADFETQKLRELTTSLSAVIRVLESRPLRISTGQKDILDCMHCFSFRFLTNEVMENDTIQDFFVNITKVEQTLLPEPDAEAHEDGLIPQDEKTCQKEICRKVWEEKYIPKDEVPGYKEDCKSAAENYIKDLEKKLKLRKLCWETMFGQEMVKLTVLDLIVLFISSIIGDLFRSLFVRIMNYCWFWDLERSFPGYPQFDVAENILHTVNNQGWVLGMIWMGLFMAPGLPLLNTIKLIAIFYIKSWAVLVTNVPHETVFKASENNNFYLLLLLMMLFLCILPVAYTLVWLKPSWHCGPFSDYERIYHVSTTRFLEIVPEKLHWVVDYITSPGIIIPTLVLLILTIWYFYSLTSMLRESTEDLKNQLYHERTEGRRKLIAEKKKGSEGRDKNLSQKWKSILPGISASNSQKSKPDPENTAETSQPSTIYASINKNIPNGGGGDQEDDKLPANIQWTSKEKQILRKIQVLERPSVSSFNPTSLRYTPSPHLDGIGDTLPEDDMISKLSEDFSDTDNRDVTEIDEEINLDSVTESGAIDRISAAPKIWISKSASMEHDLD